MERRPAVKRFRFVVKLLTLSLALCAQTSRLSASPGGINSYWAVSAKSAREITRDASAQPSPQDPVAREKAGGAGQAASDHYSAPEPASPAATVTGHTMTGGPIPNICIPPQIQYVFAPTDGRAYQWTSFSGVNTGDVIRWDFLQPSGSRYFQAQTTTDRGGSLCLFAWIEIAGQQAASLPGNWQARLFYNGALTLIENFTIARAGAGALTTVSAASFLGPTLAPDSIAAAFGNSLADSVAVADALPLPTSLAGVTVGIRDSAGIERRAPLFFVAHTQINYLIPTGAAPGTATVTVTKNGETAATGAITTATFAPGVFSANASGQGVAAAVVLRVKADGSQTFESVARFDQAQNRFVPAPIDLGPEGEQVFLILSGTGFRHRSALSAVNCEIGGALVETLFAGATPGFVGLDQANVRLPRGLSGRGEMDVILSVDGRKSNAVRLSIR